MRTEAQRRYTRERVAASRERKAAREGWTIHHRIGTPKTNAERQRAFRARQPKIMCPTCGQHVGEYRAKSHNVVTPDTMKTRLMESSRAFVTITSERDGHPQCN